MSLAFTDSQGYLYRRESVGSGVYHLIAYDPSFIGVNAITLTTVTTLYCKTNLNTISFPTQTYTNLVNLIIDGWTDLELMTLDATTITGLQYLSINNTKLSSLVLGASDLINLSLANNQYLRTLTFTSTASLLNLYINQCPALNLFQSGLFLALNKLHLEGTTISSLPSTSFTTLVDLYLSPAFLNQNFDCSSQSSIKTIKARKDVILTKNAATLDLHYF